MAKRSAARKIVAPQSSEAEVGADKVQAEERYEKATDPATKKAHLEAMQSAQERMRLVSIADRIAGDDTCFMNYKWPGAPGAFPGETEAHMRFVTRYYPYARDGALYIDEPSTEREVIDCEKKRKKMKALKVRYCVLAREHYMRDGTRVAATTLEEAHEQLDRG